MSRSQGKAKGPGDQELEEPAGPMKRTEQDLGGMDIATGPWLEATIRAGERAERKHQRLRLV